MADKMSKEEAEVLRDRNPTPSPERKIQTLEVDSGEPPAPEESKSAEDVETLRKELAELKAKTAEYKEVFSKKDDALAKTKAELEAIKAASEASTKTNEGDDGEPDISALIKQEINKVKSELLSEALKKREDDPDLQAVRDFRFEREFAGVEKSFGDEVASKYKDEALEQQKAIPGLTLAQAYKLVVPEGTSTAPATPVESSRGTPPNPEVDRRQLAKDKLAEAMGLRGRGQSLHKMGKLEEYARLAAPSVFPDREGG